MDSQLHYNYVYFNNCTSGKIDENEYNTICLKDLSTMKNVVVIPFPLYDKPTRIRRLYNQHNSAKLNKAIRLPFKGIWFSSIFKNKFDSNKPICFVAASTNLPIDYFKYLKKRYPDCKVVKIHRDLLKVSHQHPDYSEKRMNEVFDLRLSYDKTEAEQYGLVYFDEIESKIDIPIDKNYPLCDVFFAGKAKDRMPKILEAYDVLTSAGLSCFFYITHVSESERVDLPGIKYSDSFMPYNEMLYYSVNAKCMLDINQTGAVGYTSRFLEAVIYNKLLIADNQSIRESKYYNPKFIQLVDTMDQIDTDFIKQDTIVDYEYEGEFSPIHLIEQIDNELKKQGRRKND